MIELKNIAFSYPGKPIFNDFSMKAEAGECVGIVGKNGTGKSTLLKLICGVLRPDAGEVLLEGKNLWQKRILRKPKVIDDHASLIGFVMQKPERQLFAETVFEDVAFGPRNLGYDEAKVEELVNKWLDYFCITELSDKSPFKISGGQQRMAAIAGVLAMDTPNICFDEPTASLDEEGAKKVCRLISDLKAAGKTVILVSHNPAEINHLCDSIIHLDSFVPNN